MANREHQVGAVHRIEMELADPAGDEVLDLADGKLYRDGGALLRPVVERRQTPGEPSRHGSPAKAGELLHL